MVNYNSRFICSGTIPGFIDRINTERITSVCFIMVGIFTSCQFSTDPLIFRAVFGNVKFTVSEIFLYSIFYLPEEFNVSLFFPNGIQHYINRAGLY